MDSTFVAPDLNELPLTAQALARATLWTGRRMVADSIASSLQYNSPLPSMLAIRSSALKLRIYLARDEERIIFCFIKRQLPTLRLIETTLQFSLRAVEEDGTLPPRSPTVSYRLLAPPHWVLRPSDDELRQYAPRNATADDVLMMRLGTSGDHVLAICNPERGARARAVYTTPDSASLQLPAWRAAPFLELIETVRKWLTSDQAGAQEAHLAMPHDPQQMTNVHTTLYWIVEGFLSIELEVLRAKANPVKGPLYAITPSYQTDSYTAEMAISVDKQGRFATQDEPNPLSLGLKLTVAREAKELVARITLQPPDFLAMGALRDAFHAALRDDKSCTTKLRKTLDMTDADAWSAFIDSAAERAVVFRTERGAAADTDTVVLPGTWEQKPRTLILSIDATVNVSTEKPEVKLIKAAFLFDSLTDSDQNLDDKTVAYFMRLAASLKDWLSLLG